MLLWKMICSNKLLATVDLVLFLNKCDILDRKLRAGIRLAKYVRSYQDRPNDAESVQKCTCFNLRIPPPTSWTQFGDLSCPVVFFLTPLG